nr:uncharacterized protein LOC117683089 [Crassostrea gigas]
MGQSSKTLLIIVSITTIFTAGCYGFISNISKTNWTNAHMLCKKEGKMLPNLPIHTLSNESYFWTGHYSRLSGWIKMIGCYEETAINPLTKKSYHMYFSSAGRCQEVCHSSNYFVFGVQFNKCVCLEQVPQQWSRRAKDCSSPCSRKYFAETNIKFQNDCGGHQAYSLFKSGPELRNFPVTTKTCLSIQCALHDKRFIEQKCSTAITPICNKTLYTANGDWKSSEEECKVKHNSYLFGDLDLTDPKHACTLIHGQSQGPSWLGIAKEIFISNGDVLFTKTYK